MNTKKLLYSLVLLGAASGLSTAADIRYKQSGDWFDTEAGTGSNGWQTPGIPGIADNARANWGGNTITLSGVADEINNLQLGVDESGTLEVLSGGDLLTALDIYAGNNNSNADGSVTGSLIVRNGGLVTVNRILWAAHGPSVAQSANGEITVDAGGQIDVFSHLWWGTRGTATINIAGTITQFGGILGMGTFDVSTASGGTATVNVLDGGVLSLNNMSAGGSSIQAGSVIDIQGSGEVWITGAGDPSGAIITNYVETGLITGNGVTGTDAVNVNFDGAKVVITANVVTPSVPFQVSFTQLVSGFELSWPSQAGMLYNVRSSDTLTGDPSTWTLVEGNIAPTPSTNTKTVTPSEAALYYIVEEFPAP